jgi:hypothetical protein
LSKDLKQIREQTVDEENEQVVHNWNPVSEEKCPRDYLGMGDQIVSDPADFLNAF